MLCHFQDTRCQLLHLHYHKHHLHQHLYNFHNPLWNSIIWVGIYTSINSVMLFLLYLERRPVPMTELEENIYDLTFKSIKPRAFKKLIEQARWENLVQI